MHPECASLGGMDVREFEATHEFRLKTNRALLGWCEWAFKGTCTCGEEQPFFTSRKRARRWFYDHKLKLVPFA